MSVAGSSTTANTWDQDQPITLSSYNPMYNVVTGTIPADYDQITAERMNRNGSPPFQREQAVPGYINRAPNQRAPSGLAEKPTLDTSDEMSSLCSGLLCVYIFALLFLILSLVSLFLAFCLLLGVVSPVRQASPTSTPTSGTTSPPNACNCPDVTRALELSVLLENLQVAAAGTMAQLQTILNGSTSNRNLLQTQLNHVTSSVSTVEQIVNSSKPTTSLTANIVTPVVSSTCNVEHITKNCATASASSSCFADTSILPSFNTPGNFAANLQCHITNATSGLVVNVTDVIVTRRILPKGLPPNFEVNSTFLMEALATCQCFFPQTANKNFNCTTIVRRCPLRRDLTLILKT